MGVASQLIEQVAEGLSPLKVANALAKAQGARKPSKTMGYTNRYSVGFSGDKSSAVASALSQLGFAHKGQKDGREYFEGPDNHAAEVVYWKSPDDRTVAQVWQKSGPAHVPYD